MPRYVAVLLLLITFPARAQDLASTLNQVGETYALEYVSPLIDALGADLNAGWNHGGEGRGQPDALRVYAGIKVFGAFLPDGRRSFDLRYTSPVDITHRVGNTDFVLSVPAEIDVRDAPTIFGHKHPALATITARHDTTVSHAGSMIPVSIDTTFTREIIGGLLNTGFVPMAVPHVTIGTLLGTSLSIRWLPRIRVEKYGAMRLIGLGIHHSISRYLPAPPVDVDILVAWQNVHAEEESGDEVLELSTLAFGLQASREVGILTLYGGLQTERSSARVSYTYIPGGTPGDDGVPESIPIAFSMDGIDQIRGTVGLGVRLGPVYASADLGFGRMTTLSAGLGFLY